ncbi:YHS domain-containing (seleno)protein [Roseibium suaedae]|uniref:YHS domain-containing (seleno)protein n=1 Tax=Roseibium suaedae TaxID=735517 RepID=UPI001AD8ABFC|nr:YHS domain-containing (seleno)protein [Roseibium suaedae]
MPVHQGRAQARTDLFIPDPITGYALGGHDPVAYFIDRKPRMGRRKFEFRWGGAEWIFVNEGNLAAFKAAPEVYAPLFAACGAQALSEGYVTAGNPHIFAFVDGKLVFFHSVVNRFLFLVNAKPQMSDAEANMQKTGCKPAL